jgi:hypothetical protein
MPERNQQRGKNIEIYFIPTSSVHFEFTARDRHPFLDGSFSVGIARLSPASDRIYLARRGKGNLLLRKSCLRIRGTLTLIDVHRVSRGIDASRLRNVRGDARLREKNSAGQVEKRWYRKGEA